MEGVGDWALRLNFSPLGMQSNPMKTISNIKLSDARRTTWVFGAGASAGVPYGIHSPAHVGEVKRS